MKQRLVVGMVVGVFMCLAVQAKAVEFQPLGFEASSMGGAGVASSKGSLAPYYNPALLAEHRYGAEFSLAGAFGVREINLVDHIDRLADIDITETINTFSLYVDPAVPLPSPDDVRNTLNDLETISNELRALSYRNGIQLMPSVTFGAQVKRVGVGAYGISEGSAYAVIDPNRLDIIIAIEDNGTTYYVEYDMANDTIDYVNQSEYESRSFEYAISQGLTYLKLTGLAYMEIPISYGHQFSTDFGKLNVGASVKIMPGYTYDYSIDIDTRSDNLSDELDNAKKEDTAFGIDVGFLFKPDAFSNLSVGLVGKNLNTPTFDTATGGEFEVDPQIRAGMAYDVLGDRITLALDADLTENETFIPNYDSRFVGGGVNFHPFSWLSLRAGLMQNMSESDEGLVFTSGFSIGIKWLQLDVAGQLSDKKGKFEGEEIPRYARVQASLISRW